MNRWAKLTLVAGLLLGTIVLATWLGRRPHLTCHRAIFGALGHWEIETKTSGWYPNVEGRSQASLALLEPYLKDGRSELRDYRYVPGLRSDDPRELVLMYVKEPSRRSWHGDTPWFRRERRWVVLNPQMWDGEGDRSSEVAEWIPTNEFTDRLARTLRFLSENRRAGWTNAAAEHSGFLQSPRKSPSGNLGP